MEIQIINDITGTAPNPVSLRQPDKIVLSLARPQTETGQDDAMNPGTDRSQAGLIIEALVSGSAAEPGDGTREAERVLKPWGVAMLPDESGDAPRGDDAARAETTTDDSVPPEAPAPDRA